MARACAARYRKQARGACQAAATALAVVASGLALTSVLLPVLAGAATIVTGVGPAARALGTGAAAALGLGAWALVRRMTATRRPAGRKAWRRSGTGCGRCCAALRASAALRRFSAAQFRTRLGGIARAASHALFSWIQSLRN